MYGHMDAARRAIDRIDVPLLLLLMLLLLLLLSIRR
jgi:hypothetical protein